PKTSIICSPMTSLKTSIKTITYLSDTGCLEIQGASLQFDYVYADFLKKVSKVECIDSLQKITYYEFLYGRGLRYITTGAIVMNSCFKSVFPVFASRNIFNYLIKQRANDVLTYKVFYDIWKDENAFYRTMKSEGAYSPSMKPIFIPFANLLGRIITNFHPKYKNYTKE
ncbi:hypothetical protein AB0W03_21245, partial [Escherichia coli]